MSVAIDLAILTPHGDQFDVLLRRTAKRGRERWALPWSGGREGETLEASAGRLVRDTMREPAAWLAPIGAFADGRRHPAGVELSLAFAAIAPLGSAAPGDGDTAWFPVDAVPVLAPRHRAVIAAAVAEVRRRLDHEPIAFRLLPPTFTLGELQEIYELVLGRRLHKASFRRALHAAALVEATDEWRSEGRGRPARLFRFAPRRRRATRRGVRFDLLRGG